MPFDFVVSADSHLVEPYDLWTVPLGQRWGDAVPQLLDRSGRRIFFTGREYIAVDEGIISDSAEDPEVKALQRRSGWDPDARLKCMDIDGVNAEILNSTWMLYAMRIEDPELRRDCARVYNDWASEFVSTDPKRLLASAMVPLDDVAWACEELRRSAQRQVRAGVVIFAAPPEGCPPYRDGSYDPFWATAAELEVPVVLHIITGRARDLFTLTAEEEVPLAPGLTIELFNEVLPVLASDFIFGGIFDRHPDLNVALGEYEVSWLPHYEWRLSQMQQDFLPALKLAPVSKSARDYLLERVHYGLVDDPLAEIVTSTYGSRARLMWGSDFPHVRSTFPNTHEVLERTLAEVDEGLRAGIVGLNAAQLFGIDTPATLLNK